MRAEEEWIANTPLAEPADEDRPGVVESLPAAAVLAEAEINLFGHRRGLALEGGEKESAIVGHGGRTGEQLGEEESFHQGAGRQWDVGYAARAL